MAMRSHLQNDKTTELLTFKMNILFLTLSSRTADVAAKGLYSDLMRRFVSQGHNVSIVIPFERKLGRKTELYDSCGAKILGVKTLNITKTNIIEKGIGTLLIESQYLSAIKKYWGDVKFDLVIYSTPPITFNRVIKAMKEKCGAKTYLMLKDIFPQNAVDLQMFSKRSPFYWFFRRKERKLYELSDYIGCMSPANCRYVIGHNPEVNPGKVELCPNSVEISPSVESIDVASIKEKYGIPQDKLLCIYGGNLGKPQGVGFLLEAVASNEKRENVFFLVVGGGTEFGKIKSWFDHSNPHNSKLFSMLPKADYDVLVKTADVGFIFLDRRFTIPNYPSRLLSYLQNRIPIMMATDVNTDIGTIAEENGYGLWAESGDIEMFDSKLDTIVNDEGLRQQMGENGFKYLLSNYTVDVTANAILSHFK